MHNGIHVTYLFSNRDSICTSKSMLTLFFVFQVEVAGMPVINDKPLQYKNLDDYTAEEIDELFKVKDHLEITSITW